MAAKMEKNSFWGPSSSNWTEWLKADGGRAAADQSESWEIVPEAYKIDDCDSWEFVTDVKKREDQSLDEKGLDNLEFNDESSDCSPWEIVSDEKKVDESEDSSNNEGSEPVDFECAVAENEDLTDQSNGRSPEIKSEVGENTDCICVDENDGPDIFMDSEDLRDSDNDLTDQFFDPADCPAESNLNRKPGSSKSQKSPCSCEIVRARRSNGKGKREEVRRKFDRHFKYQ